METQAWLWEAALILVIGGSFLCSASNSSHTPELLTPVSCSVPPSPCIASPGPGTGRSQWLPGGEASGRFPAPSALQESVASGALTQPSALWLTPPLPHLPPPFQAAYAFCPCSLRCPRCSLHLPPWPAASPRWCPGSSSREQDPLTLEKPLSLLLRVPLAPGRPALGFPGAGCQGKPRGSREPESVSFSLRLSH